MTFLDLPNGFPADRMRLKPRFPAGPRPALIAVLRAIGTMLRRRAYRRETARALARMPERQKRDIGCDSCPVLDCPNRGRR